VRIPKVPVKQPLTHLWERHREIMRRLISGHRPSDIAKDLGMTNTRMSIIMNSPAFKSELARLSRRADEAALDIQGRIAKSAVQAMALLEQALDPTAALHQKLSAAKVVDTAQDMLDRAGHSAIKRQQIESVSTTLTSDDIAQLRAAREARHRTLVSTEQRAESIIPEPEANQDITLEEL